MSQSLEDYYNSLDPHEEIARIEAHLKTLAAEGHNRDNNGVYAIYEDTLGKLKELVGEK